jgi:periplasmic divalent cation tolerance protein
MDHLLVITTCPNTECAEELAQHLVKEHLAACVNQLPGVRSVYEWQGRINTDQEVILLIKTRAGVYDRVEQTIRARHPYDVPEVVALPIARGSNDYLSWINSLVDSHP